MLAIGGMEDKKEINNWSTYNMHKCIHSPTRKIPLR
jgi:hypothetical protein